MTTTNTTAAFIGGPLDGAEAAMTPGARQHPTYRDDNGRPISSRSGSREFCLWGGSPLRRFYAHQECHGGHVYVHATVYRAWARSR
jgi:hypothetical protein